MRRQRAALIGVFVLACLGTATLGVPGGGGPEASDGPGTDRLVQPRENGSYLWPYTSRQTSAAGRTLSLNVIVIGDDERVRRVFTERSDADWTETEGDASVTNLTRPEDDRAVADVEPGTGGTPWGAARGAARYTYVRPEPGAEGEWIDAEYQLGVGDYFGRRMHVRAYPSPYGDWTAMQAHAEYWDWFRLTHTVTGLDPASRFVERDLRDESVVTDLRREYHGFGGARNEGWLTAIELAPAGATVALPTLATAPLHGGGHAETGARSDVPLSTPGLAALAAFGVVALGASLPPSRARAGELAARLPLADLALPVVLAGLVVGVRVAGIAAETASPTTNPKLFAAVLYPVLALGPLAATRRLAAGRVPERAALLAGLGLGAGLLLDFGLIGVDVVPVRLALHRIALVGALAIVALGVAQGDRRVAIAGVGAWLAALVAALAGFV